MWTTHTLSLPSYHRRDGRRPNHRFAVHTPTPSHENMHPPTHATTAPATCNLVSYSLCLGHAVLNFSNRLVSRLLI